MSMCFQDVQRNDLNRGALSGVEHYRRSHPILLGLLPAWCTHTPVISGLKTRETELRLRSAQIIALSPAVAEETFRHHAADTVTSDVAHIGSTVSISEPTRHRLTAAHFQRLTQNVQIARLAYVFREWFRAHDPIESMRSLPKEWHIARQDG